MLGLGGNIVTSPGNNSSRVVKNTSPSLIQWTETTLGGVTTPELTITGTLRGSNLSVYVDNANDWTGTLSDYDGVNLVIENLTSPSTNNYGNFTFDVDGGTLLTIHLIQRTGINVQSLVGAASGHTVRFTFTLTLSGYEDIELTTDHTY